MFLLVAAVLSVLGGLTTTPTLSSWFTAGPRLSWSPAVLTFVGVWTAVYIADGIAGWLIWGNGGVRRDGRAALPLWWVQVALQGAWTLAFMAQAAVSGTLLWWIFAVILVLDFVTAAAAWAAWPLSKASSLIQWAILVWLLFGTVLSLGDTIMRG